MNIEIWVFVVFLALLALRGYHRFPIARMLLFAGLGLAASILILAAWLGHRGYLSLAIGTCVVAAGIGWVSYRRAEVETERDELKKVKAYLAHKIVEQVADA